MFLCGNINMMICWGLFFDSKPLKELLLLNELFLYATLLPVADNT
jgi:hypothetical protein